MDKFIDVSKKGKAAGDFIMHRECGVLVDLNPKTDRGVGKMKATITQRFKKDAIEFDVDCDCEFIFFALRAADGGWRTKYVKLFYDKDKVVPIDGREVPNFPHNLLDQYPRGYQYLSVAQHWIGHPILNNLPTLDCFVKRSDNLFEGSPQGCGYKREAEPNEECFVKRADDLFERDPQGCGYKRNAEPDTECFVKSADGLLERDPQGCGYKTKRDPAEECFFKRDDQLWARTPQGCCYKREAAPNEECFVKRADGLFQRSPQGCGYKN